MNLRSICILFYATTAGALPALEPDVLIATTSLAVNQSGYEVTASDLNSFRVYAQFAGASYCDLGDTGSPAFCKGDICLNKTITYAKFSGSTSDISAYLAINFDKHEIVVGVRGTLNIRNWITNLHFLQTPCEWGTHCNVHIGFKQAYQDILDDGFLDTVHQALTDYPGFNITVAGHSLGGAVASLLGATLRDHYPSVNVDIYTYGAPRAGNVPFVNYLHTQENGREYRLTHYNDVVPRMPPMSFRGYAHTAPEIWLMSGPANRINYGVADTVECAGYLSGDCNASGAFPGVRAHLYYFVAITHCGGGRSRLILGDELVEGKWNGTAIDKDTVERLEMFSEMDQDYANVVALLSWQNPS